MTIKLGTTFLHNDLLWEVNAVMDRHTIQAEIIDSPDDDDLGVCDLFTEAQIEGAEYPAPPSIKPTPMTKMEMVVKLRETAWNLGSEYKAEKETLFTIADELSGARTHTHNEKASHQ